MKCPNCEADASGIFDSRKRVDNVWRRRKCYSCGFAWETIEIDKDQYMALQEIARKITDNGTREP